MDGLFNLVGTREVPLAAHGKTYTLTVRTLADYAKKEAAIVALSGNPYEGVQTIEDDRQRSQAIKVIAEVALRPRIATMNDEARFDNSMRGMGYNVWRCLSVRHPEEFPPDIDTERGVQLGADFIEWYGIARISEIISALFEAHEDDIVGNSDGQAAATP